MSKVIKLTKNATLGYDETNGKDISAAVVISEVDGKYQITEYIPSAVVQILTIDGRLPSRNEAEFASRSHCIVGAKFKREHTDLVHFMARQQRIKPIEGKALIGITFYEKDERRDADNVIGGGIKYILDGLVQAGVIANDTRRYVDLYIAPIVTDRTKPRIEITITGVLKNGNQKASSSQPTDQT